MSGNIRVLFEIRAGSVKVVILLFFVEEFGRVEVYSLYCMGSGSLHLALYFRRVSIRARQTKKEKTSSLRQ